MGKENRTQFYVFPAALHFFYAFWSFFKCLIPHSLSNLQETASHCQLRIWNTGRISSSINALYLHWEKKLCLWLPARPKEQEQSKSRPCLLCTVYCWIIVIRGRDIQRYFFFSDRTNADKHLNLPMPITPEVRIYQSAPKSLGTKSPAWLARPFWCSHYSLECPLIGEKSIWSVMSLALLRVRKL